MVRNNVIVDWLFPPRQQALMDAFWAAAADEGGTYECQGRQYAVTPGQRRWAFIYRWGSWIAGGLVVAIVGNFDLGLGETADVAVMAALAAAAGLAVSRMALASFARSAEKNAA